MADLRDRCVVRRFWAREPDRLERLVHRQGGAGGATWCFASDDPDRADEIGVHLQDRCLVPGAYVSIRQDRDGVKTFKVANVRKVFLG